MRLYEIKAVETVRPTDNQKRVLAKILASPTATVAANEMIGSQNMIAARDMLMKLGLITVSNGDASVTDRGVRVATEENLIDDSGALTPEGKAYATTNATDDMPVNQPEGDPLDNVPVPPLDPAQGAPDFSPESNFGESFSLIKQLTRV